MTAMQTRQLSRDWLERPAKPPGAATRLYRAVTHPLNIVWMVAIALMALSLAPGLLPVVLLCSEAMFLLVVTRVPAVVRHLDAEIAHDRRVAARRARRAVLDAMDEEHQAELEYLEMLVESIRSREGNGNGAALLLDQHFRLEHLLLRYAQLGVAHCEARRRMKLTRYEALLRSEIEQVSLPGVTLDGPRELAIKGCEGMAITDAACRQLASIDARRRAIRVKRLACLQRNRDQMLTISAELSAISDLIQLIHEQSLIPCDLETILEDDPVARLSGDLDGFNTGMAELAA